MNINSPVVAVVPAAFLKASKIFLGAFGKAYYRWKKSPI